MIRLTEAELKATYKHFSLRKLPFEDEIVSVVHSQGIPYCDRDIWLNHLYLITSKGYYIQVSEFFSDNVIPASYDDEQPYVRFLRGVLDIAYVYAFNAELSETLNFITKLLKEGKLCASKATRGKYAGRYSFKWTLPWYSWIPAEYRNN